jgi:hypothetical protein
VDALESDRRAASLSALAIRAEPISEICSISIDLDFPLLYCRICHGA